MSDRFYVNCALSVGDIELTGPEAHHLATVCRLRPGDHACLFNGDGREYPAQITSVGRHKVNLVIQQVLAPNRELGTRLQVAAPLPRGDRAQFLVEKLTELGVTSFVPLLCGAASCTHAKASLISCSATLSRQVSNVAELNSCRSSRQKDGQIIADVAIYRQCVSWLIQGERARSG